MAAETGEAPVAQVIDVSLKHRTGASRHALRSPLQPLAFAVGFVALGLASTFLWGPFVEHHHYWVAPGDVWPTYRTAQFVSWGDLGDIYRPENFFIITPGIAVVLAPLALVGNHLGWSASFPFQVPYPSAWPALAFVTFALGSVALFALDAVARSVGVQGWRRFWLLCVEAGALWPLIVLWGHPEDALSLAFALYALLAAFDERWRRAGWLWGAALMFQPLAVLLLPLALAKTALGVRLATVARAALPSLVLLAIPLIQSWHNTTYALVDQFTFPGINHPTPLLVFARQLLPFHAVSQTVVHRVASAHGYRFVTVRMSEGASNVVSPGLTRICATLVAFGAGLAVWRRGTSVVATLWIGAAVLAFWSCLEPVMTPYYLWPPLALGLLLAFCCSWPRIVIAVTAASFAMAWSEEFFSPWTWWLPIVASLVVILICGWPTAGFARATNARAAESAPASNPLETV